MRLNEVYKNCLNSLVKYEFEYPSTEVRFLLTELLGISDTDFFMNPDRKIENNKLIEIESALKRRITGEPLQYILGTWDFMDNRFEVGRGVLIPRPETELLCEKVISDARNIANPVIYDLCSGSGCIGISVKTHMPNAEVYLVEKSKDALAYLEKNVKKICPVNPPVVIHGDVLNYDSFDDYPEADIIVSNPPYIASSEISALQKEVSFEPLMALDGGEDGLIFYRYIISKWKNKLKPGGSFFFEIGEDQGEAVSKLMTENGFDSFIDIDYNNHDRMVIGRMK